MQQRSCQAPKWVINPQRCQDLPKRREPISQGQAATSLVAPGKSRQLNAGLEAFTTWTLLTAALLLPLDPLVQQQVWLLRSYGFSLCVYRRQSYCPIPQESQTTICQSFPRHYPLKFLAGMLSPPTPKAPQRTDGPDAGTVRTGRGSSACLDCPYCWCHLYGEVTQT